MVCRQWMDLLLVVWQAKVPHIFRLWFLVIYCISLLHIVLGIYLALRVMKTIGYCDMDFSPCSHISKTKWLINFGRQAHLIRRLFLFKLTDSIVLLFCSYLTKVKTRIQILGTMSSLIFSSFGGLNSTLSGWRLHSAKKNVACPTEIKLLTHMRNLSVLGSHKHHWSIVYFVFAL